MCVFKFYFISFILRLNRQLILQSANVDDYMFSVITLFGEISQLSPPLKGSEENPLSSRSSSRTGSRSSSRTGSRSSSRTGSRSSSSRLLRCFFLLQGFGHNTDFYLRSSSCDRVK